jgi:hypothetical protein
MILVGAVGKDRKHASYPNPGVALFLAALGEIRSTMPIM